MKRSSTCSVKKDMRWSEMNKVILRSDQESELVEQGLQEDGPAIEALLRELAPARHDSRVKKAIEVARIEIERLGGVVTKDPIIQQQIDDQAAAALCFLDLLGIGGREGVEGQATERLIPFQSCGKGRKQATDGGAWDAAIWEAGARLWDETENRPPALCAIIPAHDFPASPHIAIGVPAPEVPGGCDGILEEIPIGDHNEYVAWHLTAAREGLRRAAGLDAWHTVPFSFVGSVYEWGKVVDYLTDLKVRTDFEQYAKGIVNATYFGGKSAFRRFVLPDGRSCGAIYEGAVHLPQGVEVVGRWRTNTGVPDQYPVYDVMIAWTAPECGEWWQLASPGGEQ